MIDVLVRITEYREARGWTEYQLAERSGLPQSTISSWYRKGMMPTIPSLEKICNAFGITISQLFAREEDLVALTPSQTKLVPRKKAISRNSAILARSPDSICLTLSIDKPEKLESSFAEMRSFFLIRLALIRLLSISPNRESGVRFKYF